MAKRKAKSRRERKELDKRVKDFSEEVEDLRERFGRRMERHGKRWERRGEWDSWFRRTFGVVGPLISSVFGVIIFALFAWIIGFVNNNLNIMLLANIQSFMNTNMGLFFLIFMFFSYTSYLCKVSPRAYRLISPITIAASITIALWMAAKAIDIANLSLRIPPLSVAAFFIESSLPWMLMFFLFLGYVTLAVIVITRRTIYYAETASRETKVESAKTESTHRLYRSGKDRILGGVCGGIAEYLGIDPVIIRILWIIGTLAWGFGILLYIIFWIIIPRNPKHKW
jgi:phage shock protein C